MRTASDITPSISCIRHRRVKCRTHSVEDELKRDIEETYGEITVPERDIREIMRRERRQAKKTQLNKKSLKRAFQQREKAKMIQNIRETGGNSGTLNRTQTSSHISGREHLSRERSGVRFHEIELEY